MASRSAVKRRPCEPPSWLVNGRSARMPAVGPTNIGQDDIDRRASFVLCIVPDAQLRRDHTLLGEGLR